MLVDLFVTGFKVSGFHDVAVWSNSLGLVRFDQVGSSRVVTPRVQVSNNHMGGCQNYGPFLGTLNNRCRIIIIIGTQKGTIILTTTHILSKILTYIATILKPST